MASDLKIKPTNFVANLCPTPENTRFHPMINFLNNCPLTQALTATPTMDQQRLLEFWSTASTNKRFTHLSGKINGNELVFTSTTLAGVLHLPTDPTEEYAKPPDEQQIREMLEAIGYKEKNAKLGQIVRSKMSPCWSFFFDALIRCISGKTSNMGQASGLTLHLAYGLIMGKKIHFAKLIFDDICQKVGNGYLVYPRFISLMMQSPEGVDQIQIPTPPLVILPLCHIKNKICVNKSEEEGEKPLTLAMLSSLDHLVNTQQGEENEVFVPLELSSNNNISHAQEQELSICDDGLITAHSTALITPTMDLDERLCALEVALKDQREEAIKDRLYFVSRFDEIAVNLSQVVNALGDIQQRATHDQQMMSGVRDDLSTVNGRLSRLIEETRALAKFTVTSEDDVPAKFRELLMNHQEELMNKTFDMLNAKRMEEAENMKKILTKDSSIRVSLVSRFINKIKSYF